MYSAEKSGSVAAGKVEMKRKMKAGDVENKQA